MLLPSVGHRGWAAAVPAPGLGPDWPVSPLPCSQRLGGWRDWGRARCSPLTFRAQHSLGTNLENRLLQLAVVAGWAVWEHTSPQQAAVELARRCVGWGCSRHRVGSGCLGWEVLWA